MKKIKIITGIAIAIAATIGVCNMEEKNTLSDIMLENVEALASNEGVEIVCSRYCSDGVGRCWILSASGFCAFTGYQDDNCTCG